MESVIESPLGNLLIVEENNQLTTLTFTKENLISTMNNEVLSRTKSQLDEYFHGTREEFDLPLAPQGTDFQKKVWQELLKIPYGSTTSYQEVANRLGDPKCIRAAAGANGKNPIAIIIPCHRVIGSSGKMTGYAGGIDKKKALLSHEGAAVMKQLNIF
jgi:methylated-DNA-[protein]-cysteine S-methyltransferase